jgi:hypothetical protein
MQHITLVAGKRHSSILSERQSAIRVWTNGSGDLDDSIRTTEAGNRLTKRENGYPQELRRRVKARQKDNLKMFPAPSLTTPIVDEGSPGLTTRNSRFRFSALVHVKTARAKVRFPRTCATK